MVSQKVTVKNPSGLHMRPAGKFCEQAMNFKSHIGFKFGKGGEYNAKSILSILGACVRQNDEIELVCDGSDEIEALATLTRMFADGFGEI